LNKYAFSQVCPNAEDKTQEGGMVPNALGKKRSFKEGTLKAGPWGKGIGKKRAEYLGRGLGFPLRGGEEGK